MVMNHSRKLESPMKVELHVPIINPNHGGMTMAHMCLPPEFFFYATKEVVLKQATAA